MAHTRLGNYGGFAADVQPAACCFASLQCTRTLLPLTPSYLRPAGPLLLSLSPCRCDAAPQTCCPVAGVRAAGPRHPLSTHTHAAAPVSPLPQVCGPLGEKSLSFNVPEGLLIDEDGGSITKVCCLCHCHHALGGHGVGADAALQSPFA